MAHYFVAADTLRLFVVYSPKCASRSLRAWCEAAIEESTGEPVADLDPFLVVPDAVGRYHDYWKVFFVRDPLRRLVSFYGSWVVRNQTRWCFADAERRFSLRNKTFRQFLFALQHLHDHDLEPQHHLVAQLAHVEGLRFDQVVPVENLADGLEGLNKRLGLSVPIPRFNVQRYDDDLREPVADRPPEWLREHGVPLPDLFFDEETRGLALEICRRDIAYYCEKTGMSILGTPA